MTYQEAIPYIKQGIKFRVITVIEHHYTKPRKTLLPVPSICWDETIISQTDLRKIRKIFKQKGTWIMENHNI